MATKTGGICSCWLELGSRVAAFCEEKDDDDSSSPYLRLQQMKADEEKAERARKEEATRKAERKEARRSRRELRAKADQESLEARRAQMTDKEIEEDCLRYFAGLTANTYDSSESSEEEQEEAQNVPSGERMHIRRGSGDLHQSISIELQNRAAESEALADVQAFPSEMESEPDSKEGEQEPGHEPSNPFEHFLFDAFQDTRTSPSASSSQVRSSFGELPALAISGLPESLARALTASASELDTVVDGAPEVEQATDDLDQLDRLIATYESDNEAEGTAQVEEPKTDDMVRLNDGEREEVRARATRHRSVAKRLEALLPTLAADAVSARVAMAFAAVDAGLPENFATGSETVRSMRTNRTESRGFLCAARALSTADMCWALCSEKRRLLVESLLLPSLAAVQGRCSWAEVRHFGIGWWIRGEGTEELLTNVITKLAQSSVTQLRKHSEGRDALFSGSDNTAAQLVDEAVFWLVLQGANLTKMRAFKTSILKGDAARGVVALLEHARCGEDEFMRRNAFRLLELHRYHLAASIFLLNSNYDEAAKVVSGHMCDLQLTMLVARKAPPEVLTQLMRSRIQDSEEVQRDPWLHLLLAWHSGDKEVIKACRHKYEFDCGPLCDSGNGARQETAAETLQLFDRSLRLTHDGEAFGQVTGLLCDDKDEFGFSRQESFRGGPAT